jgi:hypothetical protein
MSVRKDSQGKDAHDRGPRRPDTQLALAGSMFSTIAAERKADWL